MSKTFAEVLKWLREKQNISKRALCSKINIPATTYHQYESGDSVPENIDFIKKIINYYSLYGPDLNMFLSAYFRSSLSDRQKYVLDELKKLNSKSVPLLYDAEEIKSSIKDLSPTEQDDIMEVLNNKNKLNALLKFIAITRH